MRKVLVASLLTGALASFLTSCGKEMPDSKPKQDTEYITVSLSVGGEITVDNELLSKAGTPTNDLYGINVYYDVNKDGNITTAYAYGLFDNIGDMTIALLSGHKYKFECTLVKDGKTKLESSNVGKYEAPFGQILQNKFILGTSTVMTGIKSGASRMKGASSNTNVPKLDRYYGETTDYEPTVGGKVTIELIRTVFGAKFIVTGLANEGTLTASCGDYWSLTTTENVEGDVIMYTFNKVYECWLNKDSFAADNEIVKMTYDSDRGSLWDITKERTVAFKRNVLTTVTISVSPDLSGGTFNLSEEELGEDNYIDLGINGDGVIDTDVEPNV